MIIAYLLLRSQHWTLKTTTSPSPSFAWALLSEMNNVKCRIFLCPNRPFSYSVKETGSSVIFIHFFIRDFRWSGIGASVTIVQESKIQKRLAKYRSILILYGIAKWSIAGYSTHLKDSKIHSSFILFSISKAR